MNFHKHLLLFSLMIGILFCTGLLMDGLSAAYFSNLGLFSHSLMLLML